MLSLIVWDVQSNVAPDGTLIQIVHLTITDGVDTYYLVTNQVPTGQDPETWLNAHINAVWSAASTLAQPADLFDLYRQVDRIAFNMVKALALVTMDEINILRSQHGLADRTVAQLKQAIKDRLLDV